MNRRDAMLSLASIALPGCEAMQHREAAVPQFGAFIEPPRDGRIVLEVHFHDLAEVKDICRRLSRWPETSGGAPACVSSQFTPGVEHIHLTRPRDWDDSPILIQLGHEVLHALKASHR